MKQKIEEIKAFINDWPNQLFDDDRELLDKIAKNGRAIIGTHPNPRRIKPLCLVDEVWSYSDYYRNDYKQCKDFYEGWCIIHDDCIEVEETFFNIWLTKELIFAVHGDNAENVWNKYVSTELATDDEFCETIKTYYK